MSTQTSLADKALALKSRRAPKKKSTWTRPEVIPDGRVMAFDQTFSKTGWCYVVVKDNEVEVLTKGYLQEPPIPDLPTFDDIITRSEWMHDRILTTLQDMHCMYGLDGTDVIHEAPVLHAHRVEASLLGALGVRLALRRYMGTKPFIVENRHMLGLLVPPDERYNMPGKSHITRALLPYYDTRKGWNEHNRDALALALTHLLLRKDARGPRG